MNRRLPVRVGIMDDDCFAREWLAALLAKDLRTIVCFSVGTPYELIKALQSQTDPDVILLDVEWSDETTRVSEVVGLIRKLRAIANVICISQYGKCPSVRAAILEQTRGFFLKDEIRFGLGSAIMRALEADFLVTPGVLPIINGADLDGIVRIESIQNWQPHPALSSQLVQVFTLRALYGMSAGQVARELHLSTGTVEKYMHYAYKRLLVPWGDEAALEGLDWSDVSQETWAFHQYSLLPAM